MTAHKTLTGTENGGSPNSMTQLSPVFYYPTESGEVLIYVVKAGRSVISIINLDDTVREESYGSKAILDPALDTFSLVKIAEKNYRHPLRLNPFTRLFNDSQAMAKLIRVLSQY